MSDDYISNGEDIIIEENKLIEMIKQIVKIELENSKTGIVSDKEMRTRIEKIIEKIAGDSESSAEVNS